MNAWVQSYCEKKTYSMGDVNQMFIPNNSKYLMEYIHQIFLYQYLQLYLNVWPFYSLHEDVWGAWQLTSYLNVFISIDGDDCCLLDVQWKISHIQKEGRKQLKVPFFKDIKRKHIIMIELSSLKLKIHLPIIIIWEAIERLKPATDRIIPDLWYLFGLVS